MFSRRRSRGHYNSQQYNMGIRTPMASSAGTAAASAVYHKNLGSSAAAEALRRHSLDQTGSDAIRDFQVTGTQPHMQRQGGSTVPRRANSLTSRTYSLNNSQYQPLSQRNSWAPPIRQRSSSHGSTNSAYSSHSVQRYPASQSPGWSGSPAISRSIQPIARRNSLTGGRTNSLTRTHTVVNRDSQGRTMSLTTTTVRQMGSFELVNKKETPILSSPLRSGSGSHFNRLQPPQAHFGSGFGSGADSIHSLDSELGGIQEEPEESDLQGRLERLSDPVNEEDELELEQDRHHQNSHHAELSSSPLQHNTNDSDLESEGTVSDMTASPASSARNVEGALQPPLQPSATPSPSGPTSSDSPSTTTLTASEPAHRESSPARSALKNGGAGSKTKVSFGGAEEPYVYESYEYGDEHYKLNPNAGGGVLPSAGLAAAAAAASRNRNAQSADPRAGNKFQQSLSSAQTVQKRASQNSLVGSKTVSTRPNSSPYMPYPHARPWEVGSSNNNSQEHFSDAPSSLSEIPVPARSLARPHNVGSPNLSHSPSSSAQFGNSSSFASSPRIKNPSSIEHEEQTHAQIHAQAVALAQSQFNSDIGGQRQGQITTPNSQSSYYNKYRQPSSDIVNGSSGATHLYHGLVDDDDSSIKSDSSFKRERKRGKSNNTAGRMKSLRKPQAPTLRNQQKQGDSGRKSSLLNQAPPDLSIGPNRGAPAAQKPPAPGAFRTFSLRNSQRPDPAAFLSGQAREGQYQASGGHFKSRITDSDSEDEGNTGFFKQGKSSKKSSGAKNAFFSPNNDVKDLFKSKPDSANDTVNVAKPKTKKDGFFKRVFGKKSS